MRTGKMFAKFFSLFNWKLVLFLFLLSIIFYPFAKNTDKILTDQEFVEVKRVIDGDTFVDSFGRRVRLIGIDAPEMNYRRGKPECMALESKLFLQEKILHKEVVLKKDKKDKDKYGRVLRYAYIDGEFINKSLVEKGLAISKSYPPNVSFQNDLEQAEVRARKERIGIYSSRCM